MRISDCSSDVCSSDLSADLREVKPEGWGLGTRRRELMTRHQPPTPRSRTCSSTSPAVARRRADRSCLEVRRRGLERTGVVQGRSVSVRLNIGGSRFMNKKNYIYTHVRTPHTPTRYLYNDLI